jgi:hypothetical protein
MKGTTVLFTLIAFVVVIPAARAGDADPLPLRPRKNPPSWTQLRLKPNAKWHILGHSLALPAYFFLQTTIHEGSHGLAATLAGAEVTEFKPYPHMIGDNFVFGSMASSSGLTDSQEAWLLAAPYLADVTIFTATDLALTHLVDSDSAAAPFLLVGGMVAPLVDFLWGVNGPSEHNDTTRLGKIIGMPKWSIMLIGDAMAAVAVWHILHHGLNIFAEGPEKTGSRSGHSGGLAIVPSVGAGGFGLSLRTTF